MNKNKGAKAAEDVMEMGQRQMEATMDAQKQITSYCEGTMRGWSECMKKEFDLAADLTTSLGSVRSVPDTMRVYQDWLGRRMRLFAEEGQELMGDYQRLLSASTQAMSGQRGVRGPAE